MPGNPRPLQRERQCGGAGGSPGIPRRKACNRPPDTQSHQPGRRRRDHGSGHQKRPTGRTLSQGFLAGFVGQPDAQRHQLQRLINGQPAPRKTLRSRLVAGGDGHGGSGVEIVAVDLLDQVRLLEQDLGGPQRVFQIAAVSLQFRGQGASRTKSLPASRSVLSVVFCGMGPSQKKKTAACSKFPPYNVRSREQAAVL